MKDVQTNVRRLLERVLYHLTGITCGATVERIYGLLRGME